MAKKKLANSPSKVRPADIAKKQIQLRVRDFKLPIVRDAVVLGKEAPIGPEAMNRALGLMNGHAFQRIDIPDHESVSAIIVRKDLLKRLSENELKDIINTTLKNLMSRHEVLVVDIDAELHIEIKR